MLPTAGQTPGAVVLASLRTAQEGREREAKVIEVYAAAEMLRTLPEAERPVAIVTCDEKPGIQAIATTAPICHPSQGSIPLSSATTNTSGSVP
jgi:hypothetical protein